MKLRFLGTHNAESRDTRLMSFLIDDILAVDAGSLTSELTFPEQARIKVILLSHGHYDHIRAIPAFAYNNPDRITRVVATPKALDVLLSHLVDGVIYPKFTSEYSHRQQPVIQLVPVEFWERHNIEGYELMAVPVQHPLDAAGFEIAAGDGQRLFYTGDTGPGLSSVWEVVSPQLLIADVTWPNNLEDTAATAGHLCPALLERELIDFRRIKGYLPAVAAIHLSPLHQPEIEREIKEVAKKLDTAISVVGEGEELFL